MPRASFTTLGCKVNQYETQAILDRFEEAGFEIVPFGQPCEVAVINTCSVTGDAEAKSRYTVRRARRDSPGAYVVATGCAVQMSLNQKSAFDADLVVENPAKLSTFDRLSEARPDLAALASLRIPAREPSPHGRTRATLKVQDGCSVHCSYCSIPYTRPVMTSRPWREVLCEAQKMASQGYLEAVLTGVLIGAYGPETGSEGPDFPNLVRLLAHESGLPRLRISSIEVHQVTEEIISLAEEGLIVPHFHIPLQSGSDQVLEDMNRRYRQRDFLSLCSQLEQRVRDVMVTTDLMVGFPTETERFFEESLSVCREARLLRAHVFRFSPRPGTLADKWGDPVSPQEKQRRAREATAQTEASGRERMVPWLGRTVEALVERKTGRDGLMEGLAPNWLSVKFAGPASVGRTIQKVRLDDLRNGVFYGELDGFSRGLAPLQQHRAPAQT